MTRVAVARTIAPMHPPSAHRLDVRQVSAADVVDLRWRILRASRPRHDSIYPGDDVAVHYGIRDEAGRLIACGTFKPEPFDGQPAWRLRGMAVDATTQRGGLGSTLLAFAERDLVAHGHSNLLWCNARSTALGFYQRQGWTTVGDEFVIEDVGPHYVMFKRLATDL